MKSILIYLFISLCIVSSNAQTNGGGRTLNIVFAVKDAHSGARSYLIDNVDEFTENDGFILYLSKVISPLVVTKRTGVSNFINTLADGNVRGSTGSVKDDLKLLCEELVKFRDLGYTKTKLHLILNKEYLQSALLDESETGRWLKFWNEYVQVILGDKERGKAITNSIHIASDGLTPEYQRMLESSQNFGLGRFETKQTLTYTTSN